MILGIDYGEKHVGLAVADPRVGLALPGKTLINQGEDSLLELINNVVQEKKIDKIVVGSPLNFQGQATDQSELTEQFILKLKEKTGLPVISYDERLTSKMAEKMTEGKKDNHCLAAMIILQDYLDSLKK